MGFLDKVKEAGKAAAKGGIAMAAHSYGTVTGGKYNLCKVCMNSAYDSLTFIKLTSVEGTHVIKDDIKAFNLSKVNNNIYNLVLLFNDGEKSNIMLKEETTKNPTLEAKYKNMAALTEALLKYVPESDASSKLLAETIMAYAGK